MNWTRGLFRAWLVLAVVWVAIVGYGKYTDPWRIVSEAPAPKLPNVFDQFDPPQPRDPRQMTDQQLKDVWAAAPDYRAPDSAKSDAVAPKLVPVDYDPFARSPWYVDPIIWTPPIGLFVGGWLLIWVVRGFRVDQSREEGASDKGRAQ